MICKNFYVMWRIVFITVGQTPISSQHGAAAIFYQIFKGKKYKAADSLMSSFIATAVTQKAVLIPVFILPSVMLLILFVTKNFFSFKYQFEEEAGSAEEQPARDNLISENNEVDEKSSTSKDNYFLSNA